MITYLNYVLDALRLFAAILIGVAALPAIISGIGSFIEADDEKLGPRMRVMFAVSASTIVIAGLFLVIMPNAETRAAIAAEMEGGAE